MCDRIDRQCTGKHGQEQQASDPVEYLYGHKVWNEFTKGQENEKVFLIMDQLPIWIHFERMPPSSSGSVHATKIWSFVNASLG